MKTSLLKSSSDLELKIKHKSLSAKRRDFILCGKREDARALSIKIEQIENELFSRDYYLTHLGFSKKLE